jgi:hypothetical protein
MSFCIATATLFDIYHKFKKFNIVQQIFTYSELTSQYLFGLTAIVPVDRICFIEAGSTPGTAVGFERVDLRTAEVSYQKDSGRRSEFDLIQTDWVRLPKDFAKTSTGMKIAAFAKAGKLRSINIKIVVRSAYRIAWQIFSFLIEGRPWMALMTQMIAFVEAKPSASTPIPFLRLSRLRATLP